MKALNTTKRNSSSKNSDDFFETQDSTIDILCKEYLTDVLLYSNNHNPQVCDFSCGRGAILNRVAENISNISKIQSKRIGYAGTDLVMRDSMLLRDTVVIAKKSFDMFEIDSEREDGYDTVIRGLISQGANKREIYIVMNPPFNMLTKTMKYYLELKKKYPNIKSLSLLHSVRALEGQERHKIMEKLGYPSLILNMSKRQSFNTYFGEEKRTWTPPFSVCWSIWDDNYNGKTEFRWVRG